VINKHTNHDLVIEGEGDEERIFDLRHVRNVLEPLRDYPEIEVKYLGNGVLVIIRQKAN
jgi:hypothetical protein